MGKINIEKLTYSNIAENCIKAELFSVNDNFNFKIADVVLVEFSGNSVKYAFKFDNGKYFILNKTNIDFLKNSVNASESDKLNFVLVQFVKKTLNIGIKEYTIEKPFNEYKKGDKIKGFIIKSVQKSF